MYRIALIALAIVMTALPKLWWYEVFTGPRWLFTKGSLWETANGHYCLMGGALVVPLVALWLASRKPAHG